MTQENHILAKEGWPIIGGAVFVAMVLQFISPLLSLVAWVFFLFSIYFFRNPARPCAQGEGHLLSPADGKVIEVKTVTESDFLNEERTRVTIFMSPFDVHVNRSPAEGRVAGVKYHAGEFLAAFDEKASEKNERSSVCLELPSQDKVVFVQIAGWLARRIVSYPQVGDELKQGQIYGVIRFGSRMDVYLPQGFAPNVKINDRVKAGDTLLALRKES